MNELEHRRQVITEPVPMRVIRYRYIKPTEAKGARIQLHDDIYHQQRTIPVDDSFDRIVDSAVSFLMRHGWLVVGHSVEASLIICEWSGEDLQLWQD